MLLLCPAGETEPVLLEEGLALAITSPRPRWFRRLVLALEQRWGMELQGPLAEGDPLTLEVLGFEAWAHCQRIWDEEGPLEIAAAEVF
jgi:hypothetical protein